MQPLARGQDSATRLEVTLLRRLAELRRHASLRDAVARGKVVKKPAVHSPDMTLDVAKRPAG